MGRNKKLVENKEVFFDDLTHTYLTNHDRKLTGVTGMMKAMGLSADYTGIPDEVLERAAERGSAVHKAIENWCTGLPLVVDPEYSEEVCRDLEAFKRLELPVLANEYLVSDNISIASSIDIVLKDLTLVDIKTTSRIHEDAVSWQLSIYKYLFELQNPGKKVKGLKVLHLREGQVEYRDVKEKSRIWVMGLIQAFQDGTPWTNPEAPMDLVPTDMEKKAAEALLMLESKVVALKAEIKAYEAQQEVLRANVMDLMKSHNVTKWKVSDRLSFTYVAPTTRLSLDSLKLKAEQPVIYRQYMKESAVKESLKINIK